MAINLNIVSKFDQKGLKRAQTALRNFASGAVKAAGAAVAGVGLIGVQSVRSFADFDAQMTKSLAIMGDVSDTMRNEMSDAAREVAKTTTFSADQAAESFFFLASAGLDAEQSVAALPQVAAFAQAGMFDMATATDLATDAQSALGLASDDAQENLDNLTRVTDVFVKANTLANTSVQQISEALTNKAGAALRVVGKDVEEGAAVLALFADQGVKGAEAGEKLNVVLRDVPRAAARNSDAFRELGLDVLDADGNLRNMADIVDEFTEVLGPMSDAQAAATLENLGLTRSVGDAIKLLLDGGDSIREYESALRDAGGTTEEVAENQLETLSAKMELLRSRIADTGIAIGMALAPLAEDFITNIGPTLEALEPVLIEMFEALVPVIQDILARLPELIESFIPMIPIIGDLSLLLLSLIESTLPVLQELFETIGPVIETFTGFMAEHGEVVGALIITFALLRGAVMLATGAMGIFAGANVAAAGASSGFFAILARHPILAVVTASALAGIAFIEFADSTTKAGDDAAKTYIFLAEVVEGFVLFFRKAGNLMIEIVENSIIAAMTRAIQVYNAIARTVGGDTIDVPEVNLPRISEDTEIGQFVTKLKIQAGEIGASGSDAGTAARTDAGARLSNLMRQAEQFQSEQAGLIASVEAAAQSPIMSTPLRGDGSVNYNVYVEAGMGVNGNRLGEEITSILERYEREAGPVFESAQ